MHYYIKTPDTGWLTVERLDGKLDSLCAYTKVEVYKKTKGRTYLRVMDGVNTDLRCSLKDENASQYLSKRGPVQGAALLRVSGRRVDRAWYSKAREQTLEQHLATLSVAGKSVSVTLNTRGNPNDASGYSPLPAGRYKVLAPDYPHSADFTNGYRVVAPTLVYDRVWFPIEYGNNSRYIHVGNYSEGCVTVVELEKWKIVYEYLIKHRMPGGRYVGELVISA
jgi:hypothetical protein